MDCNDYLRCDILCFDVDTGQILPSNYWLYSMS